MAITVRGGLYSLDLLLAFLAACFTALLLHAVFSQAVAFEAAQAKGLSLSRKAMAYADRLVKVSQSSFSPGLALSDPQKSRALPNRLSLLPVEPDDPAIKQVYLETVGFPFRQNLFLADETEGDCLVVERFVLLDVNGWPEEAVLGVKACG